MSQEYIYTPSDPSDNKVRYVGRTFDPQDRFQCHIYHKSGNKDKVSWISELRQAGLLPQMEVVEQVSPDANAGKREKYWILHYTEQGEILFNRANTHKPFPIVNVKPTLVPTDEIAYLRAENARLRSIINKISQLINIDDEATA